MKRFLCGFAVVAMLAVVTVDSANAQWGRGHSRHGHHVDRYSAAPSYGSASRYGGHGGYGHGHVTPYRGTYHDTTHYDYHAPTIRRHYDHFHVVPGHYDLHRSGHWHR